MQYIQHVLNEDETVRTIGINLSEELAGTKVLTGDYVPALLAYRMSFARDTSLVVKFVEWSRADEIINDPHPNQVYWADAGGITALYTSKGDGKWGAPLRVLGLNIVNAKKLAKRMKEIGKTSRFWSSKEASIKWVDHTAYESETFVDGNNAISMSYAVEMAQNIRRKRSRNRHIRMIRLGSIKRLNLRYLFGKGLIKGDTEIISDERMIATHGQLYDIVAPVVNLKSEIWTDGWCFGTVNPHHDHGQAMFDVQSVSWLREWLFPRELIKDTLTNTVDAALENLREGKWPAWMILPEAEAHAEGGADSLPPMERISEQYLQNHMRWQVFGMKAEQSASIMGQAANIFATKIQSKLDQRDADGNWKPKLWIPLPWAVYGHIITHEVLTDLLGYEIPAGCEDKLFYHEESGSFSLPGRKFAAAFERHGTWDLDDSAKFFLRLVSEAAEVEGVSYEAGEVVAIIVRSPNSDGEYSIQKVESDGFPLYHQYGEMPSIDLKKRPRFIEEVQAKQVVRGLPANNRVMSPDFTEQEAQYSIRVQMKNPGVGPTANAMMVYYASKQGSPASVADSMGEIVDCVQQTPYEEGFKAIKSFNNQLWKELERFGRCDSYLLRTRVPESKKGSFTPYEGYFAGLLDHVKDELKRFREESRIIAFANRQANLIPEVQTMVFSQGTMDAARKWVTYYEEQVEGITRNPQLRGNDRATKQARSLAYQKVMRNMVTKLEEMKVFEEFLTVYCGERPSENWMTLLLGIYRYVTIPGHEAKHKFGRSDRILFAPGAEDERCTMDYFIEALQSIGAARVPTAA